MKTILKTYRTDGRHPFAPVRSNASTVPVLTPLAWAICAVLALAPPQVLAQAPELAAFDIETLKQRGIDPKLAEYFRDLSVEVTLNRGVALSLENALLLDGRETLELVCL